MIVSNRIIEQFFRPINQKAVSQQIKKGSLITFNYSFWKNDAYPLIIVSQILPGNKIWGVNIHYLTFNYIRNLLKNCGNPSFSYQTIKGDNYLKNAYRSYKWLGIRTVKVLDCNTLLNIMGTIRSFDPADAEIVRKNVQQQLRQQINPKINEVNINTSRQDVVPTIKTVPTVSNVQTQNLNQSE